MKLLLNLRIVIGVLYSAEVFKRGVPEKRNSSFATWALDVLFHYVAVVTVAYRFCRRECHVNLVRRFNFEWFKTEGAF